jgi:hypothetical protein
MKKYGIYSLEYKNGYKTRILVETKNINEEVYKITSMLENYYKKSYGQPTIILESSQSYLFPMKKYLKILKLNLETLKEEKTLYVTTDENNLFKISRYENNFLVNNHKYDDVDSILEIFTTITLITLDDDILFA